MNIFMAIYPKIQDISIWTKVVERLSVTGILEPNLLKIPQLISLFYLCIYFVTFWIPFSVISFLLNPHTICHCKDLMSSKSAYEIEFRPNTIISSTTEATQHSGVKCCSQTKSPNIIQQKISSMPGIFMRTVSNHFKEYPLGKIMLYSV